jgi:serine/threonine-protein kinase
MAAHHELLDVRVAVKLLSPELVRQRSVVDRFLREARAAARLKSEHVARVTDLGTISEGQPYIVMELLEGEDLENRLQRVGRAAIRDSVDYVLQALEAMSHAHTAGIIHRDLKPANLYITSTPDGRELLKVLDFGIAKLADTEPRAFGSRSRVLTGENAAIGSPGYMSPEQVRGVRSVDHRTDIWALGAILYELLTGDVAFDGKTVGEVFAAVLHQHPKPMRSLRPEIPAELESIVNRCLQQQPADRFASVGEMACALAPFGTNAWIGLAARIQQTLVRAGKAKGAEPGPAPRADYAAETLLGTTTVVSRPAPRTTLVAVLSGVALAVALAVVIVVRARPIQRVAEVSSPAVSSVQPSVVPSAPITATTLATASSFPAAVAPAASSAPAPTALGSRAAKPILRHSPKVPKSDAPGAPSLPGVLDSPE